MSQSESEVMTPEERDQVVQKELEPASQPTEKPKHDGLKIVVGAIGVIMACCILAACASAIVGLLTMARDTPPKAELTIIEPISKAKVDSSAPIRVSGAGVGLRNSEVVVRILDEDGFVRAQEETLLQGANASSGGEGR